MITNMQLLILYILSFDCCFLHGTNKCQPRISRIFERISVWLCFKFLVGQFSQLLCVVKKKFSQLLCLVKKKFSQLLCLVKKSFLSYCVWSKKVFSIIVCGQKKFSQALGRQVCRSATCLCLLFACDPAPTSSWTNERPVDGLCKLALHLTNLLKTP